MFFKVSQYEEDEGGGEDNGEAIMEKGASPRLNHHGYVYMYRMLLITRIPLINTAENQERYKIITSYMFLRYCSPYINPSHKRF